ncbi:MAG: hopanoid biosynthesis-associated protein HpnK [Candidatus Tyrphobacter sp.]
MKHLIVTADDFGISTDTNEAVERAHREGILTTASLMVAEGAAQDAVRRARGMPNLGVGLHLALSNGRSMLSRERIPDLVDASGSFDTHLVRAGIRYFASPRVRAQLRAEIRAQFEAFAATGLPLDHVSGHNHLYVHPTLFAMVLEIGPEFGMKSVRVPFEPCALTAAGIGNALLVAPWAARMRTRLKRSGIFANDAVFGLNDTGRLDEARALRIIDRLPDGVSELYTHPQSSRSPGYARIEELQALLSPRVRAAIAERGVALVTYGAVA